MAAKFVSRLVIVYDDLDNTVTTNALVGSDPKHPETMVWEQGSYTYDPDTTTEQLGFVKDVGDTYWGDA